MDTAARYFDLYDGPTPEEGSPVETPEPSEAASGEGVQL
jgi:tryptophan synthase beta chain